MFYKIYIGQLPRVSGEDPERIRVDSVVETSVCSLFFVLCKQIFSFFIQYSTEECSTVQLLCIAVYGPVQYSTVQYSTVQYITTVISGSRHYRPAPSSGVGVGVGVGVGNIL